MRLSSICLFAHCVLLNLMPISSTREFNLLSNRKSDHTVSDKSRSYSLSDVTPKTASSISSHRWKNFLLSREEDNVDLSSIAPMVNSHIFSDRSIDIELLSIIASDKFRKCISTITGLIPDRRLNSARYSNPPDRRHVPIDRDASARAEEERNIRTTGLTRRSISIGVVVSHSLFPKAECRRVILVFIDRRAVKASKRGRERLLFVR